MSSYTGCLDKMAVEPGEPARYALPLDEARIPLNPLLGQAIRLRFTGQIRCCYCQRRTSKSFGQGYCFPCFRKLARCDSCIVSPEKCHWHLGTCREPDWAQTHCHTTHVVYLANASGLKVGITRGSQVPTRWLDQGAIQALPIARVSNRFHAGLLETACKQFVADKTDWRALLRNHATPLDLPAERDKLAQQVQGSLQSLVSSHGLQAFEWLEAAPASQFSYPVLHYPLKTMALNLDKTPVIEGVLTGIKGQYLFFPHGALNVRKFTSYEIEFSC